MAATSTATPVRKILQRPWGTVVDIGQYVITIAPKRASERRNGELNLVKADEAIWKKIERDYRKVRSQRTREKYPFLYER